MNRNYMKFNSINHIARVAGFGLLAMAALAAFAEFFVRQRLIVQGDALATANSIMANELLFRLGIFSFVIVIILDVVVAWALYILLKPVNKSISMLMAWFRLVYAAIFAIALVSLFSALQFLSGADYLKAFEPSQLYAEMMLSLNAFNSGWTIGLVFFGVHLLILGFLAFKSGYIPKILGVLLVIAGLGYLIDSLAIFLLPNYEATITLITFIGEVVFMLWLLIKGVNVKKWEKELLNLPEYNPH